MTKSYDFSVYDFADHIYSFATMTPLEILEKKKLLEQSEMERTVAKPLPSKPKPVIKPKLSISSKSEEIAAKPKPAKPVFKPRPMIKKKKNTDD